MTSYWSSEKEANQKGEGPFGLQQWLVNTQNWFSPEFNFVACGTYSNPDWSPLPMKVKIVNAGVPYTKPYCHIYWMYDACAYTAAMAYALNRQDWDLLVVVDNDCLVGAVDFDALLREFMARPELFLTPGWHGRPGGPFHATKREGAVRWLHMRRRANLIETPQKTPPLLIEEELGEIFKGRWWNPWPTIPTMRQDYGFEFAVPEREPLEKSWPFVRLPHPAIVEEYARTQTAFAKPALAD